MSQDGLYSDAAASQAPAWLYSLIQIFHGVPFPVWGSIAFAESSFNPMARNLTAREDSVGLFALNRNGGQGQGYTVEALQNPITNAIIAVNSIRQAYQQHGDDIGAVAIASGHPGVTADRSNALVQRITSIYNQIKDMNPVEAFVKLATGIITPGPGLPGLDPTTWVPSILHGVRDAFSSWVQGVRDKGLAAGADSFAPFAFMFFGVNAVLIGLVLVAMQSRPAQAAAGAAVASGNPYAAVAGSAVKVVGASDYQAPQKAAGAIRARRSAAIGEEARANVAAARILRKARKR